MSFIRCRRKDGVLPVLQVRSLLRRIAGRFRSGMKILSKFVGVEVLVLGDSHSGIFHEDGALIFGYWYNVVCCPGATISGLKNPNSVTQAQPIFEKALQSYSGRICILLLGEVDAGFVIWYRAEKYGLDVQEVFEQAISNYIDFIEGIPKDKHVIVISAPLPTIRDGQDWGEVANLRKEVTATQVERTRLTIQLNQRMKAYAESSGVEFIALDDESLGPDGIVKKELLNEGSDDHHYERGKYIALLRPRVKASLRRIRNLGVGLTRS